jgi:hypothetical protein
MEREKNRGDILKKGEIMPAKILRQREVVYSYLNFYHLNGHDFPWGVDCDEDGKDLDPTKVPDLVFLNKSIDNNPVKQTYTKVIPTLIECDCGEQIELWDDVNECPKCKGLWNAWAQSLRPQNEWEDS